MSTLTLSRRKPGPQPKDGPKAKSRAYAVYPIDEAAIRWWTRQEGSESESAALREMVKMAMRFKLGEDWAARIEEAA